MRKQLFYCEGRFSSGKAMLSEMLEEYDELEEKLQKMRIKIAVGRRYLDLGGETIVETMTNIDSNLKILSVVLLEMNINLEELAIRFNEITEHNARPATRNLIEVIGDTLKFKAGDAMDCNPAHIILLVV